MRMGRALCAGLAWIRLPFHQRVRAGRRSDASAVVLVVVSIAVVTSGCSGETPPRDTQRETQLAARIQAAGSKASWYASLQLADGRPVINILRSGSLAALELVRGVSGGSPTAHQVCTEVLRIANDPAMGSPLGINEVEVDSTGSDNLRSQCSSSPQPS
jgi:hypothetical protein